MGTPCRIYAWVWLSISVIGVPAIASECQEMEPREALADVRQTYMDGFNAGRLIPEEFEFRFEPAEVRVAADFAVERGVTAGTETIPAGKYVLMYVREPDGCWRIAWSITNSDATPPARR